MNHIFLSLEPQFLERIALSVCTWTTVSGLSLSSYLHPVWSIMLADLLLYSTDLKVLDEPRCRIVGTTILITDSKGGMYLDKRCRVFLSIMPARGFVDYGRRSTIAFQ
uniref:HotDog ACOT-type domain-containing protein n=1 Tax=Trichuris muris TaxID=70415 RepID=A0A5S6Q657_TRIMR